MQDIELKDQDLLLLCSDGLTSMLDDEEILEIVLDHGCGVKQAAACLVDAANRAGGDDNITVVVISFSQAATAISQGSLEKLQ